MKNKISNFLLSNEKIKIINYVIVSDNDISYISEKNKTISKVFKIIYIFLNLLFVFATFYPYFMLVPEQKENLVNLTYVTISGVTSFVFVIDYCFRWLTFPFRNRKPNVWWSILKFPITGVSIILILSTIPVILSAFFLINNSDEYINVVNVLLIFRIGRILLLLNTFYAFKIFGQIIGEQRVLLINSFFFSITSFLIFAIVIYNVEAPENPNINNFWDAFYFTIITVTTIGYGDIMPVTQMGRNVVMLVAIIGVIIFSIPTGIIAGSVIEEIKKKKLRGK
ncbi:MAG: ion transporter [Mycoplasmoidaceae bacterium]